MNRSINRLTITHSLQLFNLNSAVTVFTVSVFFACVNVVEGTIIFRSANIFASQELFRHQKKTACVVFSFKRSWIQKISCNHYQRRKFIADICSNFRMPISNLDVWAFSQEGVNRCSHQCKMFQGVPLVPPFFFSKRYQILIR